MSLKLYENIGVCIPEILLPAKHVDMEKWSVVACDQYTSQPEYWSEVEKKTENSPSSFHLIYPEVYLEEENPDERIKRINQNMKTYLKENILEKHGPCFIYIDRKTSRAASRKGLIVAVDLEMYHYSKGSQTLIRATEGTVIERLPPRIKIRENASIELPHIMLLVDDYDQTVIEPLSEKVQNLKKIYDFDLMMDGEHITGYKIEDNSIITEILAALEKLADIRTFRNKYQVGEDKRVLLFAVGDGNHSLASAKGHWENIKKTLSPEQAKEHPARYALVEVVNVHDSGLSFEPIHRVVFNADLDNLLDKMLEYYKHSDACYKLFNSMEEAHNEAVKSSPGVHSIPFVAGKTYGVMVVGKPKSNLEVGTLQQFLDEYIKSNKDIKIDYIHGDEVVNSLGSREGNIGFFLPPMDKNDLFKTVILDGVLPRKTFSMGEAEEKRFYLECRKITCD